MSAGGAWPTADELGIEHGTVRRAYEAFVRNRGHIGPDEWDAILADEPPITPPYPPRERRRQDTIELPALLDELERWLLVDPDLERAVRVTYALDPFKVSVLASQVVTRVKSGEARSPGGLLLAGLRIIYREATP